MNNNILSLAKNLINRENELQAKGIKIIKQGEYTKFYYDLLQNPNFNDAEVVLCRGITFRNNKIVCCPFFKFGNYGESYVPNIDWANAKVFEKLDGSLITLWYDKNKWNVSTSKTINAFECSPQLGSYTFGDLFSIAAANQHLNLDILNKNYTYIFELTSPYNKVVIPYEKTEIWHIGTRDNTTLEEIEVDIDIQQPKQYYLSSLEDCIKAAAAFSDTKEGFVVVDKYYNRIKVKSPNYFVLHKMANNGTISKEAIIKLLLEHNEEEYLSYFPEKKEIFNEYKDKLNKIITCLTLQWEKCQIYLINANVQKEKAILVKNLMSIPDFGFKNLRQEIGAEDYLRSLSISKVIQYLEGKEWNL